MSDEVKKVDAGSYLQVDPIIIINLKGKDYSLEINNYAIKGILKDTGYNLLSSSFSREQVSDPVIMGAFLFWGLKTHQPDITLDEVDKAYAWKNGPYIVGQLYKALSLALPEADEAIVDEGEVKEASKSENP